MADMQWGQVIGAFLSGGLMGAVVTVIHTTLVKRIQPVGINVDNLPVFQKLMDCSKFQTKVMVVDSLGEHGYDNLYYTKISVVNRGNTDIPQFSFGINMAVGEQVVAVECIAPDRYHIPLEQEQSLSDTQKDKLDYILEPFNRGDKYIFNILRVLPSSQPEPQVINFVTKNPIKFVNMPTTADLLAEFASVGVIPVGPLRIRWTLH